MEYYVSKLDDSGSYYLLKFEENDAGNNSEKQKPGDEFTISILGRQFAVAHLIINKLYNTVSGNLLNCILFMY